MDLQEFLKAVREQYDTICAQPTHPLYTYAGAAWDVMQQQPLGDADKLRLLAEMIDQGLPSVLTHGVGVAMSGVTELIRAVAEQALEDAGLQTDQTLRGSSSDLSG